MAEKTNELETVESLNAMTLSQYEKMKDTHERTIAELEQTGQFIKKLTQSKAKLAEELDNLQMTSDTRIKELGKSLNNSRRFLGKTYC